MFFDWHGFVIFLALIFSKYGMFFQRGLSWRSGREGVVPSRRKPVIRFWKYLNTEGKKIDSNAYGFLFTDNWNYMHMHYFVVRLREVKSSRNAHYHVGEFGVVLSCLRLSSFVVACLGFWRVCQLQDRNEGNKKPKENDKRHTDLDPRLAQLYCLTI